MRKPKRVEPSNDPFADFDTALKKMSEEWDRAIREAFKGSDAVFAGLSSIALSLPSLPPLTFEPWSWS